MSETVDYSSRDSGCCRTQHAELLRVYFELEPQLDRLGRSLNKEGWRALLSAGCRYSRAFTLQPSWFGPPSKACRSWLWREPQPWHLLYIGRQVAGLALTNPEMVLLTYSYRNPPWKRHACDSSSTLPACGDVWWIVYIIFYFLICLESIKSGPKLVYGGCCGQQIVPFVHHPTWESLLFYIRPWSGLKEFQ